MTLLMILNKEKLIIKRKLQSLPTGLLREVMDSLLNHDSIFGFK